MPTQPSGLLGAQFDAGASGICRSDRKECVPRRTKHRYCSRPQSPVFVSASPNSVAAADAQNVSTGEHQTFPLPGNSSSFSSVPLGALVDANLKAKIWSRQYVDLALLTRDSSARYSVVLDTGAESSSWHLKEQPLKKINTIASWTDAFLISMAIYVDCFPYEVEQMLKYMQLVRGMASGFSNMFLHNDKLTRISGNCVQRMP